MRASRKTRFSCYPNVPSVGGRTMRICCRTAFAMFQSSCRAFRGNGGLPASEWAGSDYVDYQEEPCAKEIQEPELIDLIEAESLPVEQIRNTTGHASFAVTPGCVRRHAAVVRAVEEAGTRIVLYAFPNHRLIDEWMEAAKSWVKDGVPVIHFYVRRDKPRVITCFHKDKVDEAIKLGYLPGKTVCPSCHDHPQRAKRRSYKSDGCPYYRQLDSLTVSGEGGGEGSFSVRAISYAIWSPRIFRSIERTWMSRHFPQ